MTQILRGGIASPERYDLGEGVLWDAAARVVRWVDIRVGRVLSARLAGDRLTGIAQTAVGQTVGAVAPAADGGLLVAAARGLATISPLGALSFGPPLLNDDRPVRFNDGAVDPQGRFIVGSLSMTGPTGTEVLLRVSPDGAVETLRSGIGLSNGIGWSPDGATIYHIDTDSGTLSSHSYGPGGFATDEPWRAVITGFPGQPDGMRVDAEGLLWVAQWGAGCVVRYDLDGGETARVEVEARQPSCPGFIGEDLDLLAITSATEGLENPGAADGAVFLVDPGVTGLPVNRWAGSTSRPLWTPEKENA